VAVEIRQMRADFAQINEPINRPQQMILGDVFFQRELIEQRRLRFLPRSHHRSSSRPLRELNQQVMRRSSRSFSTWRNQDQRSTAPVILDAHVIKKETDEWSILLV
jgi:hypothetical protein